MSYLTWKLLHMVSVTLFLGNIAMGLFWAAHAHRSRDLRMVASTFAGIVRSDRLFTVPGVVGITVCGVASAMKGNLPMLSTGWILWPIILFTISGLVFAFAVAPLQGRIVRQVTEANADAPAWADYAKLYRRWEFWGLVALIAPAIAFVIMVLKPSLPGF